MGSCVGSMVLIRSIAWLLRLWVGFCKVKARLNMVRLEVRVSFMVEASIGYGFGNCLCQGCSCFQSLILQKRYIGRSYMVSRMKSICLLSTRI